MPAGTAQPDGRDEDRTAARGVLLRDATDDDLVWVERAVRTCPDTMAEIGGFYGSASTRLAPLLDADRRLLIVVVDGEPVGFVDADSEARPDASAHTVGLSWFIVPARRRGGLARRAVQQLARALPHVSMEVSISSRNAASLALARSAGFVEQGRDEHGDLRLVRPAADIGPS